jgi:hypothetical protein
MAPRAGSTKAPPHELRERIAPISQFLTHVDTLAAGSIVVIATFAEKFQGRAPGGLLAISVICFAVAIVFSLFGFWVLMAMHATADPNAPETLGGGSLAVGLIGTALAFVVGLVFLAIFAALAVT